MNTKRSAIDPMPEYFDRYINKIDDVELLEAFDLSLEEIDKVDVGKLRALKGQGYEPGKWTVNQVIGHIIDWERILTYRTLLYARRTGAEPDGLDENLIATNSNVNAIDVADLLEELSAVRKSTRAMFAGFDGEMLTTTMKNWKYELSILASGFMMLGHQKHHFGIIAERYYPLVNGDLRSETNGFGNAAQV